MAEPARAPPPPLSPNQRRGSAFPRRSSTLENLEKANERCFRKLVAAVDEKIAAMAGLYIKPLTRKNVEEHLALIGLEPELATHTKLSQRFQL